MKHPARLLCIGVILLKGLYESYGETIKRMNVSL